MFASFRHSSEVGFDSKLLSSASNLALLLLLLRGFSPRKLRSCSRNTAANRHGQFSSTLLPQNLDSTLLYSRTLAIPFFLCDFQASRGVGGSRDRYRRDFGSSRYEDSTSSNSSSKRSNNPPSRHLWVGNLSHSLVENELTDHFLHFGELDTVAFQPGRSYAFINFKREDDAIAAMKDLQGFPLAGNPLRIEFAKAVSFAPPFSVIFDTSSLIYLVASLSRSMY